VKNKNSVVKPKNIANKSKSSAAKNNQKKKTRIHTIVAASPEGNNTKSNCNYCLNAKTRYCTYRH